MSASFRGPGNEKLRSLVGALATTDNPGLAAAAFNRKEAAPRARESAWVRANPATRGHSREVPATVVRERGGADVSTRVV